jgi:hypothetical protein
MSIIDIPGKIIDVNLDLQQDQTFPEINLLTGSDFRLLVRTKIDGEWLSLSNVTAKLAISEDIEGEVTTYFDSVDVDDTLHLIAVDLDQTNTALPFEGFYSIVLSSEGSDYKVGSGEFYIIDSEF